MHYCPAVLCTTSLPPLPLLHRLSPSPPGHISPGRQLSDTPGPCVQVAVCSVQCAVWSVQCAVFSVECGVCSVQCAVCAVCSVQCAVCSVQCAVSSTCKGRGERLGGRQCPGQSGGVPGGAMYNWYISQKSTWKYRTGQCTLFSTWSPCRGWSGPLTPPGLLPSSCYTSSAASPSQWTS